MFREFHEIGKHSTPFPNSPESDSDKLGGSTKPSEDIHVSKESNGKHKLSLVETCSLAGNLSPLRWKLNGAMEIGNSLSCLDSTSPGVHDLGLLRSPSANKRANLFLYVISRPTGLSSIIFPRESFA